MPGWLHVRLCHASVVLVILSFSSFHYRHYCQTLDSKSHSCSKRSKRNYFIFEKQKAFLTFCIVSERRMRTLLTFLPRDAMLSAVYAVVVCLCVCLSLCVCVSVTLRYCIKTAKRRITQTTPHDSPMTLVF